MVLRTQLSEMQVQLQHLLIGHLAPRTTSKGSAGAAVAATAWLTALTGAGGEHVVAARGRTPRTPQVREDKSRRSGLSCK